MSAVRSGPVAFFHRGNIWGGAEESLVFNGRDLLARGWEVAIVCIAAREVADRYESEGFRVHRLLVPPPGPRGRGLRRAIKESLECRSRNSSFSLAAKVTDWVMRRELEALRGSLDRIQPALFFANMCAGGDYQFLRLASWMGFGTLSLQQIGPPEGTGRRHLLDLNSFCGEFVSNSVFTRDGWIARGMREERHGVVYYAIPRSAPSSESLRSRLGLPATARMLGSVGRLAREKHLDEGIRGFAAVAAKHRNWHYLIVGDGPERAALGQQARATPFAARIHFVGEVRNAASYLGQFDAFLHPAHGEHFGRVVAEAMLSETITIGHDSGGVPEMIIDGQTGLLFSSLDSLVERLDTAMSGAGLPSMRERALTRILDMCGPRNADRMAGLVTAAAARSGWEVSMVTS